MNENKSLVLSVCLLFLISATIGVSLPQPEMDTYQAPIDLLGVADEPNFKNILKNNIIVISTISLTGPVTLGASTLATTIFNGAAQGALASESISKGMTVEYLKLFIPHAIFELPALWLAGAAGFKIPYEVVRYLVGRKEYILDRRELMDYVYLSLASVVLIVVAAWVEANVTMRIAESMT